MKPEYISLHLTSEDAGVLERALTIRIHDLRLELSRTDDHEFRKDLRHQLERLETIEQRLNGPLKNYQSA